MHQNTVMYQRSVENWIRLVDCIYDNPYEKKNRMHVIKDICHWHTGVTALCPWARHINPSSVFWTRTYITERLMTGRKESNQTKQKYAIGK